MVTAAPLLAGCLPDQMSEGNGVPAGSTGAATSRELELLAESGAAIDGGWVKVSRVVDGDTLIVARGVPPERVRLIGVNAPESVDPRRLVQCFGREASRRMEQLAEGRRVLLATDPALPRLDTNGRLLAYAWLESGEMLNLTLLEEGYANEYVYDRANPYGLRSAFRAARDEARRLELGLWAPDTCAGDYDATPGGPRPSGS